MGCVLSWGVLPWASSIPAGCPWTWTRGGSGWVAQAGWLRLGGSGGSPRIEREGGVNAQGVVE